MSVAADTSASPLTAECALAKSAKGATCVQLVGQVLDNPSLYVFGELLDMPNVQALADGPPAHAAAYELLKIFAYGTWKDYTARAAQLGQLSAAQATKLKKLSVVSLAAASKSLPYDTLLSELEIGSVRELENLLIECVYGELLSGKLDQQARVFEVHHSLGRDLHPSEVAQMGDLLSRWHSGALDALGSIRSKLETYKARCEAASATAAELNSSVENVRANLRAQDDSEPGGGGGGGGFDDRMDFEEDKQRKSGRTKGKLAMGFGPRK